MAGKKDETVVVGDSNPGDTAPVAQSGEPPVDFEVGPDPEDGNELADTGGDFPGWLLVHRQMRVAVLKRSLTNIKPTDEQVTRIEQVRAAAQEYAETMINMTMPSREQSIAITELENSVMWAVKSIVLEGDA